MTDDSVDPRTTRPQGGSLRLYAADQEDATPREDAASESAFVECDDLPVELACLGEELHRQAGALAATYPAGSAERGPLTDAIVAANDLAPERPKVETVSAPSALGRAMRTAAVASVLTSIVVAGAYFASQIEQPEANLEVVDADEPTIDLAETPPIEARMARWSLADDGDYRRLERLLRDRSEPEREAALDLIHDASLGEGDAATIRISF